MNISIKEGKNLDELLNSIAESKNVSKEELIYTIEEKKGGLFKSAQYTVKAVTLTDISDYTKSFLLEILEKMGLKVTFESKIRESQIIIKMYSDQNNILIGKNGQTLAALQTIVRQSIYKHINSYQNVILDVENYKDKQKEMLERLAKNIAREVSSTKLEVSLDSMNSYERRIVHNILSENKNVSTESVGEEPNRYIIIKPKKD